MPTTPNRVRRVIFGGAVAGAAAIAIIGCTRPGHGGPHPTRPTMPPSTAPTTDGHGHTEHDHANLTTTTAGPTPTTAGPTPTTGATTTTTDGHAHGH
jgi:hypothetical protein